ncbi:MAG: methyltransferase domain-containing protein [Methanobacterium sp.]|nr:methyltransferase domain-containing protein [Methanobacterium sp.]
MSSFEESEWSRKKHVNEFVENADIYVLERRRLFKILKSFFRNFLENRINERAIKVLDLGCGNGVLIKEILSESHKVKVVLVDGSYEMLENARENFKRHDFDYIHATFQELLENESTVNDRLFYDFDLIISSLAIHHLYKEEKKALFMYIYNHLNPGGYFLNIDVIKAPKDELESWYRILWSEWIAENEEEMKLREEGMYNKESFVNLPEKYKNNPDNHPDKLLDQLNMLDSAGFEDVDCYYKYGIFSIFGGRK